MQVGDLVVMLRPVIGKYNGFGIITSARLTLASPNQQPLYTVHWNDKMGNCCCHWGYELEVLSESR